MARSYFCDHCNRSMEKGGRVTLNIAVDEPHKAPLPSSFNKELCPLCYENLMAAIAEALSKPNQVPAAHLAAHLEGAMGGGLQRLVDFGVCKAGVGGEINARDLATIPRYDGLSRPSQASALDVAEA
jgi:hypothetical protein